MAQHNFFGFVSRFRLLGIVAVSALLLGVCTGTRAQMTAQGTVTVAVVDATGGVVQGAKLELQDSATNEIRTAETQQAGGYSFVGLPAGTYKLTVTKAGFQTELLDSVTVQAYRVTDIKVTLKVGAAVEKIVVAESSVPLLETSSSAIASTIDMKQIEDLPIEGRDISSLAFLTPGFTGTPGNGTWNGLPVIAQGNNIDGVLSSTSRMKFAGNSAPGLQARLEGIEEMTVQTGQTDLNQGLGTASMQVNFVTRRGSNNLHGRIFEDFRNTVLDANSWFNNANGSPRNPIILNDFGGSVGGKVIKDKLFFFGSLAISKQPGGYTAGTPQTGNRYLTATAQQGIFTTNIDQTKKGGPPAGTQINLFQIAQNLALTSSSVNSFPGGIADELTLIKNNISGAAVSGSSDANLNSISWLESSPTTSYFPAARVDYNFTQKLKLDFSLQETKINQPNASAPPLPGSAFASQTGRNYSNNYITSLGLTWTLTPNITNQFRGGYYYNAYWYGSGSKAIWAPPTNARQVSWAYGNSAQTFTLPVATYYPLINAVDNAAWTRGNHTVTFGFDFYREQDHYWNAPDGINNISLGLNSADPDFKKLDPYLLSLNLSNTDRGNAEALYATLVGRVTGVGPIGSGFPYNPKTNQYATTAGSAYNLDELQKGWGLYAHDSQRLTPHFTFNYGLRWDFTGDDHDLTKAYHGATPSAIFGPSGVGNLFKPGTLTGDMNPAYVASSHQYNAWNVSPQPTIGLAWNPNYSSGLLGSLFSNGSTVIRAGFDVKRFTEPYQFFWNNASNHGLAFFQSYSDTATGTPGCTPAPAPGCGQFPAGSLTLADPNNPILPHDPNFTYSPTAYAGSIPESTYTWNYYWGGAGIDPHIHQPYVMEWNLGVQKQMGRNNVLEVRYVGHRSVHQWISENPNEVNIFENGFLKEFKNAQSNLAICMANPSCASNPSFGNQGLTGQVPLPIFTAAFACPPGASGCTPGADFTNTAFTTPITQGAAGVVADILAYPFGTVPYICNLVGNQLAPCTNGNFASYTTAGQYPLNFFQANPLAAGFTTYNGAGAGQAWEVAAGYGNYHAMQIDFRQRQWHGMQFDVNYTFSHTLGLQPENYQGAAAAWLSTTNEFTARNLRLNYGPTTFDLRHVVHASGTFDLPFGNGKALLNKPGPFDKVVGGWSLGTIILLQTGAPFQLFGGYNTFNDYADGGLILNGITKSQLQNAVGVYPVAGANFGSLINPKILTGNTSGNCNSVVGGICQNTTPGTFGTNPWLYGPHVWNVDMSLAKVVPFGERVKFKLQAEALNLFNHTNWTNAPFYLGSANVQSSAFGQAAPLCLRCNLSAPDPNSGARLLELRANITF